MQIHTDPKDPDPDPEHWTHPKVDFWYINLVFQLAYVPICVLKEVYRAEKVLGGIGDAR